MVRRKNSLTLSDKLRSRDEIFPIDMDALPARFVACRRSRHPHRVLQCRVAARHDPDRLIDDGDYTPRGARQWNGERYRLKIGHIARVIDELDADLLLLTEIENESVLRDLMLATSSDYNYIHRHTSDRRGMDIALLYRGSLFFPGRVRQIAGPGLPRELLVVDGLLDGEPLTLIGAHLPSQLNRASYRLRALGTLRKAVDSILRRDPDRKLLVMGDMNCTPQSAEAVRELGIRDPADTVREGTYRRVPLYTPLLGRAAEVSAATPTATGASYTTGSRQVRPRRAVRTAAKSRRSLRARLDASLLRPVQRVSAAHFSLARIPRRLQRPSARIRRAESIGTGIRRRPEDNVRSPLHVLKKKRTFVDFQATRKEFSKRTLVVKNIY